MDNLELMKQEISNLAKEKKEEFEKVSDYICATLNWHLKNINHRKHFANCWKAMALLLNEELQKCRRLLKQFLILENQGKQ